MPQLREISGRSLREIDSMLKDANAKDWAALSGPAFSNLAKNVAITLERVNYDLRLIARRQESFTMFKEAPKIAELIEELADLQEIFIKNYDLEQSKLDYGYDTAVEKNENFVQLQKELFAFLTKASYELQRVKIASSRYY